jgi:ketosteroid isomerase-like protein
VSETSEKEIESLVRSFTGALFENGDVASTLSFIIEDAVMVFPTGRPYNSF